MNEWNNYIWPVAVLNDWLGKISHCAILLWILNNTNTYVSFLETHNGTSKLLILGKVENSIVLQYMQLSHQ